jgi:2-polyprenyl-3-methyl-5-hydroxy-6-metoxy-1,4-benzoquinol methylase
MKRPISEIRPEEIVGALEADKDKVEFLKDLGADFDPQDKDTLKRLLPPLPRRFFDRLGKAQARVDSTGVAAATRFGWFKRAVQRIIRPFTAGQTEFNDNLAAAVSALADAAQKQAAAFDALMLEHIRLRQEHERVLELAGLFESRIGDVESRLRAEIEDAARKSLDESQRTSKEARENTIQMAREEIALQIQLLRNAFPALEMFAKESAAAGEDLGPERYLALEEEFRGEEADIGERQRKYAGIVRDIYADSSGALQGLPTVDIGCGRGEFLQALDQAGIEGIGFDLNPAMIERCEAKGLRALAGDALARLDDFADGSLGGITALQVIEHLRLKDLASFFALAKRKLHPKGVLLVETINPDSVYAMRWFYMDWTHNRPLQAPLVEFLLRDAGFSQTEVLPVSPVEGWRQLAETDDEKANENFHKLNNFLFACQDYAIVARPQG